MTFCAAFLTGAAVWLAFDVVKAINPFLPWEYPPLGLLMGMTFPGGAPHSLHYLSHVAQTWVPFLVAFLVSYALTNRQARFSGAIAMYIAFLIWSWGMVILDGLGVAIQTIFAVGLAGTFLGGLGFYLWLVAPVRSKQNPPAPMTAASHIEDPCCGSDPRPSNWQSLAGTIVISGRY